MPPKLTVATSLLGVKRNNLIRIFMSIAVSEKPITSFEIAKELGISKSGTDMYLFIARKTDYIEGIKGPHGGFRLKVPASEITLLDIVGKLTTLKHPGLGLRVLSEKLIDSLDLITLQDVLDWDE